MRYVKIFIYIIYLIVYGYSAYKASIDPENSFWGYVCAIAFGMLAIMGASDYGKNVKQKNKEQWEKK